MNSFFQKCTFIDLNHILDESIPTWSGGCGFRLDVKLDYSEGVKVHKLSSHAGVGTHLDAPSHFIEGGKSIADLELKDLIVPALILDVRKKVHPDFFVQEEDIDVFEKKHGKIQKGSLFIANTGWDKYWKEPNRYRNLDKAQKMHFPGFSEQAAEYLLKREIVGIGIDTLSPDGSINGRGASYPVHKKILGEGKYILENLTNLDQMPEIGSFVIALPARSDATEATARVIGCVEKKKI